MRKYLSTLTELYAAAVADLGPMDQGTYSDFEKRVQEVARQHGIQNPKMIIDIKFKANTASSFGVTEQPYPIIASEWNKFREDAKTMAEYMPKVHVVDGDKYTAPI
ncbi:MAG: hypothetical protein A2729_05335 [Candidatus Buchananbacteria bacterium RIFCSPHIGHO2_01_FULL_39_14]|uniref:Uncharacterized protein n=1 Tax=Candidatus Buchananbacteria bacterium RIFCSPHIGHO2_01_FULL_39_14 TaxID=1797532 RepID=A0A1G1XTL7_9BACT|nr:MAG: hypothetical protein A2729_05335 [Candidatus Buchananbacteria bacterium RIFCSPHIGHO2_01_FULL_39_14]